MEDLYALYLKLNALDNAGASDAFAAALNYALGDAKTTTRAIEINAAAAVATATYPEDAGGIDYQSPLDFYQFQQVWERYRNTAPKS